MKSATLLGLKSLAAIVLSVAILVVPLLAGVQTSTALAASQNYSGYPTFSILTVVPDSKVTIVTYNLPANDTFAVLMNKMGTRGVNGVKVATLNTGAGGSQTLTYDIPASLHGLYQIAIRLQSTSGSDYFAYNWFYNRTSGGGTGGPVSSGTYPTMTIVDVVKDTSVTFKAVNLPANDEFLVRMGYMGTRGVNGIKVKSFGTGEGGTQKHTFDIPAELRGLYQIAIRIESKSGSGYYAYNWFYNNTTTGGTGGPVTPRAGYSGYPTFSITGVVRNTSVTIRTSNLPPNDEFRVLMNRMGTKGVNGYKVTSFGTGAGGAQTFTFNIPAELAGLRQIAIRIESKTGSGYFAYNWFYNNTTP